MIKSRTSTEFEIAENRDTMRTKEFFNVFLEQLQHGFLAHDEHIVHSKHGLNEIVLPLWKIALGRFDTNLFRKVFHAETLENVLQMCRSFLGVEIYATMSKIAQRVTVVRQPQSITTALHVDFDFVVMTIKKRSGNDTGIARLLDM